MSLLLQKPAGRAMLAGAVMANIAAHVVIRRMAQIRM